MNDVTVRSNTEVQITKVIESAGSEVLSKLARYMPMRIVLRLSPKGLEGKTEESFHMNWSTNRVRIFWSGKAYSILGEHIISGPDDAEYNASGGIIYDPLGEQCPVIINWEQWLKDMALGEKAKYAARNALFELK